MFKKILQVLTAVLVFSTLAVAADDVSRIDLRGNPTTQGLSSTTGEIRNLKLNDDGTIGSSGGGGGTVTVTSGTITPSTFGDLTISTVTVSSSTAVQVLPADTAAKGTLISNENATNVFCLDSSAVTVATGKKIVGGADFSPDVPLIYTGPIFCIGDAGAPDVVIKGIRGKP